MKAKHIALILIPLNIILAYFVFNSINSEVKFQKVAKERIAENKQKLEDLRQVQLKYKQEKGVYAKNFDALRDFLENDSIAIVKAEEDIPDTLIDGNQLKNLRQAINLGIIKGEISYASAKDSVFDSNYLKNRKHTTKKYKLPKHTNLHKVPHSNKSYVIHTDILAENENVSILRFEISTTYADILPKFAKKKKTNKELDAWIGIYEDASTTDLERIYDCLLKCCTKKR